VEGVAVLKKKKVESGDIGSEETKPEVEQGA